MDTTDWEMVDDASYSDTFGRAPSSKGGVSFDEASSVSKSSSTNDVQASERSADDVVMHAEQTDKSPNDQAAGESGMQQQPEHGQPSPALSRPGSALSFEQLLMSPSDYYETQPAEERFEQLLEGMEDADAAEPAGPASAPANPAAASSTKGSGTAGDSDAEEQVPAVMEIDTASDPLAELAGSAAAAAAVAAAAEAPAQSTMSISTASNAADAEDASYELCQVDNCLPEDSTVEDQPAAAEPNSHDTPRDMAHEPMWLTVSLHVDPACTDAPVQLAVGHMTRATGGSLPKPQQQQQQQQHRGRRNSGGGIGGNLRLLNWLLPSLLCIVTLHHLIRRGSNSSGNSSGSYMGPVLQSPAAGLCYCRGSSGSSSGGSSGLSSSGYGGCSELVLVGCSSSGLVSSSGNLSSCSS